MQCGSVAKPYDDTGVSLGAVHSNIKCTDLVLLCPNRCLALVAVNGPSCLHLHLQMYHQDHVYSPFPNSNNKKKWSLLTCYLTYLLIDSVCKDGYKLSTHGAPPHFTVSALRTLVGPFRIRFCPPNAGHNQVKICGIDKQKSNCSPTSECSLCMVNWGVRMYASRMQQWRCPYVPACWLSYHPCPPLHPGSCGRTCC